MRIALPLAITFLFGTFFVAEFFVPHAGVHDLVALLQEWVSILASMAFILGGINVIQVNLPKIARREKDWGYKLALVGSAIVTAALGFFDDGEGSAFQFIYAHVFAPADATMFALLSFFIASAAFRAFRARNAESSLMLISAIVVMLAVIPLGEWLFPDLPLVKDWILDYPNNAGRRAIFIGAALGGIATGFRVILGLERSHLGGDS